MAEDFQCIKCPNIDNKSRSHKSISPTLVGKEPVTKPYEQLHGRLLVDVNAVLLSQSNASNGSLCTDYQLCSESSRAFKSLYMHFPPVNKAEFPTYLVFNDILECRVI